MKAAGAGVERQRGGERDTSSAYCVTIMAGPLIRVHFRKNIRLKRDN